MLKDRGLGGITRSHHVLLRQIGSIQIRLLVLKSKDLGGIMSSVTEHKIETLRSVLRR